MKAVTESSLIYIEQQVTEALCKEYPELKRKLESVQHLGSRRQRDHAAARSALYGPDRDQAAGEEAAGKYGDAVANLSRRMDAVEQAMNARFDEVRRLLRLVAANHLVDSLWLRRCCE